MKFNKSILFNKSINPLIKQILNKLINPCLQDGPDPDYPDGDAAPEVRRRGRLPLLHLRIAGVLRVVR